MSIGGSVPVEPVEGFGIKKESGPENPEEFLEHTLQTLLGYNLDTQNSFVAALKDRLAKHRAQVSKKLRQQAEMSVIEADSVDDSTRELKRI